MARKSTQDKLNELIAAGYTGPTDQASVEQTYAQTATPADQAANPPNVTPEGPGSSIDPGGQFSGNAWQSGPGGQIQSRTQALINSGMDANSAYSQASSEFSGLQPGQTLQPGGPGQATNWGGGGTPQAGAKAADDQFTKLMQAISATNEQDFQEAVRQFNENHSIALRDIGLKEAKQQFDQQVTAAGLTGTYNGQPTQEAQKQQALLSGMYQGHPTESARQFNVTTARDLADMASKLTGPSDYFQFLNATNMGKSILDSLQSGQSRPRFGGETDQSFQPQSLSGIMSRLGIGSATPSPAGAPGGVGQSAFAPQPSGFGGNVTPRQASGGLQLPGGMGKLPFPHQVNPATWDSWGETGQKFILSAASAAGFDPVEYKRQIDATRPGTGKATDTGATVFSSGGQSAF